MKPASLTTLFSLALLAAFAAVPHAAPPPANKPASTVFDDTYGTRIQSDTGTAYIEAADCVRSWFNPSQGNYYFRTASNTYCEYWNGVPQDGTQRAARLDFSSLAGPAPASCLVSDGHEHQLDACGANLVVDTRLIADDLFKTSAVDTPVTLHFDLYPNFVNDTAFQLRFISRVPITGASGTRTLSASGAGSVAELSVRRTSGKRSTLVPVAQYYMPFSMAVTPCPTGGC